MATSLRNFARDMSNSNASNGNDRADMPKADVWMNVGYEADDVDSDGNAVVRFIGTPLGIAVDTQSPIDTSKTRSAELAKLQTYQNKLLADLQEEAKTLEPGEERIVNLQVQIRRVKAPAAVAPASESSSLSRRTPLFAAAAAPETED